MNEEGGLFDDINADHIDEYSVESGADNFSFDDGPGGAVASSDSALSQSLDRSKRNAVLPNANSRELQFESLTFDSEKDSPSENASGNKGRRKNKNRQQSAPARNNNDDSEENKDPLLDKLVKDIRQKVKDSRKFWSNLPYQVCNNEEFSAPSSSDANCWNGNGVDR